MWWHYAVGVLGAQAKTRKGVARGCRGPVAGAVAVALAVAGCGSAAPAAGSRSHAKASAARASRARISAAGTDAHGTGSRPSAGTRAARRPRLRTACRSVVHIGDSTSDGLVLPAYQPDPALRIAAQYRRVGVTRFIPEVSGARSIVETWHGFPNGYTVAQQVLGTGYHGCWVIALGTNDTADVAVGSAVGLAARIQSMMSLIGNQPVMWVNVKSLLSSGPYAEFRMRQWNRALLRACPRYPNMRVYNWAAAARPSWFIPDGIHYTPIGYAWRSRLIADALARAFPAARPSLPSMPRPLGRPGWQRAIQPTCLVS
jgi:hypothetical protein